MATDLQTTTNTQIEEKGFTQNQITLIQRTVAKGATPDELKMFLYQAHKTGLDPLAKQIYFVKRNTKNGPVATIQTSIDGFRLIAERSGKYAGQDEPEFEYLDPNIKDQPHKCTIRVYKFSPNGERYCAAVGVAFWKEYCPPPGQDMMWRKMPHVMLSKVTEQIALRKAFPQDLSGLYGAEEMEQAGSDEHTSASTHQDKMTSALKNAMGNTKQNAGVEEEENPAYDYIDAPDNVDPETGEIFDTSPILADEIEEALADEEKVNDAQSKLLYVLLGKIGYTSAEDRKSIIGHDHTHDVLKSEMKDVIDNIKTVAEEKGIELGLKER